MRKRLITHLVTMLLVCVLVSASIMIVPAAVGSDQPDELDQSDPIISLLEQLAGNVSLLTYENFTHKIEADMEGKKGSAEGKRGALVNKIGAVINQIEAGAYEGAVDKLKNDIKEKILEWIKEDARAHLIDLVDEIINTILEGNPPVAIFTWSSSVPRVNQTVTFDASASYDPDGNIVSYFWDFGDSTTITETDPITTHVYTTAGTYTVTLTVTDNDGLTDATSQSITIEKLISSISVSASLTTVPLGENTTISGAITPTRVGVTVTIWYRLGEEETWNTLTTVTTDEDSQYSYTWTPATVGTYELKASWPGDANTLPAESSIIIVGVTLLLPPVASFTWSPPEPVVDGTVTFDATESYDPDGYIVSYLWTFGDGAAGTGKIVEHIYASAGTYAVTLFVTDNDGLTGSTSADVTVSPAPEPPEASFTYEPIDPFLNQNVTFNASASTPDGGVLIDPDSYAWDFNSDGIIDAYGMIVTHTYTAYGNYTVTLNVTDSEGSWDIATDTVRVYPRPPIANFTYSPLTPYTDETVTFNAIGSYDPDGDIVWYYWNFGDDTYLNVTDTIAHHVYVDDETYTVTLVVSDNEGLTGTVSAAVTVLNRPPVAIFTESATTVLTGEVIHFNASDSYDPDGSIVSYFWDFDDGTNATGVTVDHAYDDAGNYTVILTVTDDDGASSSLSATKEVKAPPGFAWALFAAAGLGIAALIATVIYLWYRRRKKRAAASPQTKPVVTLYIPASM